MQETFRAEENQRYDETYHSREYNRSEETFGSSEIFRSAEYREKDAGGEEPSAKRSAAKSAAKVARRRREIMTGGILSATGAVAGAAVIAVAITVMAALNVTAVFSDVTSYSVCVNFLIENTARVPLTACLQNEGKQYLLELDSDETVCRAYFDFLVPDTEYLLTVKDGEGKSYFSQTYRTAPYEQKLFPVEQGAVENGLFLQFEEADLTADEYLVYLSGELLETDFGAGAPLIRAENLLANTEYEVRIVNGVNGELLFRELMTTGNALFYETVYLNANEAMFRFDGARLAGRNVAVYLDNVLQPQKPDEEEETLTLSALQANTGYQLDIYDTETWELLLRDTFTTPEFSVVFASVEAMENAISIYHEINLSEGQSLKIQLLKGEIPVEEQEIVFQEESPDGSSSTGDLRLTVFENCDSFTGYTVRVLGEDFVPLYECECRTKSLFLIPEALIQSEEEENGEPVTVFRRMEDSAETVESIQYSGSFSVSLDEIYIECVSANGLTLPVSFYGDSTMAYGECRLFTQYARSSEIYELRMYSYQDETMLRLEETRLIRVADDGAPLEYPAFEAEVTEDESGGGMVLTVAHTGGNLFADGTGGTLQYIIESGLLADGRIVTEDFAMSPTQTWELGTPAAGTYEIRFILVSGDMEYVFFVTTVMVGQGDSTK